MMIYHNNRSNLKRTCLIAVLLMGTITPPALAQQIDSLALSKQVIPLDDGDPRPVMALAAIHGSARGQITGKAADVIKQRSGSAAPVFVDAKRIGAVPDQPGCSKVRLTYSTSKEFAAQFAKQPIPTLDIAVCPNKIKAK